MDHFNNPSSNHHLLFLGEADIHLLVDSHQFTKVHVSQVTIGRSTSTTKNIIGMWLFNVRGRQLLWFLVVVTVSLRR